MVVPMIKIEHLQKHYGNKRIFDDLNMEIHPGQIVGLYGASGIGKSTLAKILCGVMPPDGGSIYLDNHLLYSASTPYDRKRGIQIQMVYQQPYSSLDGSQKLKKGFQELIRYHKFVPRSEEDRQIQSILAEVGLEPGILEHLPHQISGGEAQRIAIARCLLFHPSLLILDEATSMLDVSTQANVIALVKRVIIERGGSVLLISHDRELVDYLCNQIYMFDNFITKE